MATANQSCPEGSCSPIDPTEAIGSMLCVGHGHPIALGSSEGAAASAPAGTRTRNNHHQAKRASTNRQCDPPTLEQKANLSTDDDACGQDTSRLAPPGFTRPRGRPAAAGAGYCRAGCRLGCWSGRGFKLRSAIVCSHSRRLSVFHPRGSEPLLAGGLQEWNSSTRPLGR